MKALNSLFDYSKGDLRHDLLAGITVMLLAIPQSMAYALLAGLPISAGLLSAIFAVAIMGVCGSSRHVIIGPTNATALLIQAGTASILQRDYASLDEASRQLIALQLVAVISLMAGVIQLIAAACRLGRFTHLVGSPVMLGYISGVACALMINQLFPFLGISPLSGDYSLFYKGVYLAQHLSSTHATTAAVGLGAILLLILLKRSFPRWPHALVMLTALSMTMYLFQVDVHYVGNPGQLTAQWMVPNLDLSLLRELFPEALAIAILGMLEATSVSGSLAMSSGQAVNPCRDVFGLGMANLCQAFIGSMPASGSPSRSFLNYRSGARTRMASVFSGLAVLFVVMACAPLLGYVPRTALAAMLIVTAVTGMVDRSQLVLCLTATRSDALVLILTFLSACFFHLDHALYIGLFLFFLTSLNKMRAMPSMRRSIDPATAVGEQIRVLELPSRLLMGGANHLPELLAGIAKEEKTRVIVLKMEDADHIDATACLAFRQAHERVKGLGCHLLSCAVHNEVKHVFRKSGIARQWGEVNIFTVGEGAPEQSVQRCMEHARTLVKEQDRT